LGGPAGGSRLASDGGLEVQVRVGTAFARAVVVACAANQGARAARADQQLAAVPASDAARGSGGLSEVEEAPRGAQGAVAAHYGEH
jgi:hypothetical protein